MKDRLKELRKSLGLNQTEFGKRLGVKSTAISKLEKGERNFTDQMVLAVCREYGVREAWLREGEGAMFAERGGSVFAAIAAEYGLSETGRKFLECYAALDDWQRDVIDGYAKDLARSIHGGYGVGEAPAEPEPEEEEDIEAEAEREAEAFRLRYIEERLGEKKQESPPSSARKSGAL
jgi:transcriptional regulator with XRE-family HTH domain